LKRSPVIRRYFLLLACSAVIAGCETVPTESSSKTGAPSGGKPATETIASTDPDHSKPASNSAAPAAPAVDLWARIRDGYAIPDHNNARVKQQFSAYAGRFSAYAGRKDYWLRVSERATPYLHLIVEAIDERGLPQELALLPVVESGFQPFAYSHGRAAGIWQFIPATGRHYGLKQNWWYDGRRDVTAATEAALDYLTYLNEMFDGDWLLALAAYNAGEGTVSRAIKRNRQAGRATDYWSLDLPRETMHYVPRLLAVSEIVAHPERHDIALTPISNEPAVAVVDLEHQVDLALAAELAEIDIETLYALNPGFNRWATAPEGPHRLKPACRRHRVTPGCAGSAIALPRARPSVGLPDATVLASPHCNRPMTSTAILSVRGIICSSQWQAGHPSSTALAPMPARLLHKQAIAIIARDATI
jgi:membrane-bound lytic murein transglycosylase D